MIVQALVFYLFAGIVVLSALMVVAARNPVYSVLFLILVFFNAAGLFILMGAEFIGVAMLIVNVGAVGMVFIFVLMLMDISFDDLREGLVQYAHIGLFVCVILFTELALLYSAWSFAPDISAKLMLADNQFEGIANSKRLGSVLYTDYVLAFHATGLILFVVLIGASVFALRARPFVNKQLTSEPKIKKPEGVVEMHKISPKTGARS